MKTFDWFQNFRETGNSIREKNLKQIERTNQRGGKMLSIVDLVDVKTISVAAAAFCGAALRARSSFFTGAVPGGAGKTTLMAALLGMLPHDERIITASDTGAIDTATAMANDNEPVCLLAHEVGSGSWYAYIWGDSARAFLKARDAGARIVTTLHADNPAQVREIFKQCGIDCQRYPPAELQLFIKRLGMTSQRRVTAIYFNMEEEMQPIFQWQQKNDTLKATMPEDDLIESISPRLNISPKNFANSWEFHKDLLSDLSRRGTNDFRAVASAVAKRMEPAGG